MCAKVLTLQDNSHPAIIEPEAFDLVQAEIERRMNSGGKYSGVGIFSNKIKCAECGSWYGAKVWHSTDKYRKVIYRCNHKFDGEKKCTTPHLTEDEIRAAFVKSYNSLMDERDEVLENVELVIGKLSEKTALENEKTQLEQEVTVLVEMVENCIAQNARVAQNQETYQEQYNSLTKRYDKAKERLDTVTAEISSRSARSLALRRFEEKLKECGVVEKFDEVLWGDFVDYVTADSKKRMTFTFKDGSEITV